MKFGEHWYDKLWSRLEEVAEVGDEDKFNELMSIRANFGEAEGKEEVAAVRILFEQWEELNA